MSGMVYLVGAGPGDPELLTVKAVRILRTAEAVLTDALVSSEVRALIPSTAITLDVGKRCGKRSISQTEINFLLVQHAKTGKVVVRLKSGDPLVFGRAGEEMEVLRNAGVPFEVVPGITAALGAAAVSQIPLTDRRLASSLVITTAHHAAGKSAVHSQAVASPENTFVFYMPMNNYSGILYELLQRGVPAETPCVVVSRVYRAEQQFCRTTLRKLPEMPVLPSPAVVIVGRVTEHHIGSNGQHDSVKNVCKGSFFETEQTYVRNLPLEVHREKDGLTPSSEG